MHSSCIAEVTLERRLSHSHGGALSAHAGLQVVNGHVDNLACFIRPGVVALSWCDDVNDPQARPSPQHIKLI